MASKLPQPVTSPISKIWIQEYARKLRKLPISAKKRINALLDTVDIVDESVIEQIKTIIGEELSPGRAKPIIEEFTSLFWQRGSEFAVRQLKRLGINLEVPFNLAILDEETVKHLQNLQLDLVTGLSEDLKKRIALELREGLMQGESIPELRERIRKIAEIGKRRAKTIARTESVRVFNHAALTRYNNAGIKKWRWLTAMDERVCQICMSRHGRVFESAADLPPHASHPNCRCTIVPAIEKPAEKRREESEVAEITGDRELDEKISKALNNYEKILKEEGSFSRALNKFVNGEAITVDRAEERGKTFIKFFGKGGPEEVRGYIQNVMPYRINPKVVENAGNVGLRTTAGRTYRGRYISTKREIQISKWYGEKERTFMHEYGHHLEHVLYTEESRKFFIARIKKRGYKLELLRKHKEYSHLGFDVYHFDGFDHIDPYAGRVYLGVYEDEHFARLRKLVQDPKLIETDPDIRNNFVTEMLSVGMEYFTREELMKELWEKDRELFGFILTLLRG